MLYFQIFQVKNDLSWQEKDLYRSVYGQNSFSRCFFNKIKPSSFKHPWLQANLLYQSTKLNQINFWLTHCINQVKLNQINSWLTLQSYGFKRTSIYVRTSNVIRLYTLRFTLFASSHTIRFTTNQPFDRGIHLVNIHGNKLTYCISQQKLNQINFWANVTKLRF